MSVGALLLCVAVGCSKSPTFPFIDTQDVETIEIDNEPGIAEPSLPVRSTDPEAIRAFIASIQNAKTTEDHKCRSLLQVVIVRKSSKNLKLLLLPGHKDTYYEFRQPDPGIYRVPRQPFIAALKQLGLPHVPLRPGDVTVAPLPPNQKDDL
jgi:hypothetical protein